MVDVPCKDVGAEDFDDEEGPLLALGTRLNSSCANDCADEELVGTSASDNRDSSTDGDGDDLAGYV